MIEVEDSSTISCEFQSLEKYIILLHMELAELKFKCACLEARVSALENSADDRTLTRMGEAI